MKVKLILFAAVILHGVVLSAQPENTDSLKDAKEKKKQGLNFGALPVIAFDSDMGMQFGVLANIYHFGNGNIYPRYKHSLYMEWSRTTRGSGKKQILYDSEYLIPGIRVNADACYLTEQALHFYGVNGYGAFYDPKIEDKNSASYISRVYYRMDRKLVRLRADFQGSVVGRKLRWLAGYSFFRNKIGSVDIGKLNKGKSDSEKLPDTTLLYDKYVEWGIIPYNQKNGGTTNFVKVGAIYDTRDNEPNPMKGIWSEILLLAAPSFLGNKFSFVKLVLTHRQYFTLKKDVLNVAYRLSYQGKVAGDMPFCMLPFVYSSSHTRDGLGGAKTLRGVLKNRAIGEDLFYFNLEFRWKFLRFVKFNQNFYFALAGFTDWGKVIGKYTFNTNHTEAVTYLKRGTQESWHKSYGIGFYGAMNQNFIASINYGLALDRKDGRRGLYIGLDFLF